MRVPRPLSNVGEDRRLIRRPANLAAIVSGSATKAHPVRVSNVTGLGCRVEDARHSAIGQRLLLSIAPIGPIVGAVIWRKGNSLGFEFATPLHPAVLEHVERTNPGARPPASDRHATLDDFMG